MYQWKESNSPYIGLHDCRAEKMDYKDGVLSFEFSDGFFLLPGHFKNKTREAFRTGSSRLEYEIIDEEIDGITIYVFKKNRRGNTIREEWEPAHFIAAVNDGSFQLEFLYEYKSYQSRLHQCCVWFDKSPYHYECEIILHNENVLYRWNAPTDEMEPESEDDSDSRQVRSVIENYSRALDLLDAYDHQNLTRPKGTEAACVISYEECKNVIRSMRFGDESELFGKEKDDSFKGSIGNIYQTFAGVDVYESLEEKAANLLYFVTKNHSFFDGNKRIAATMFLYFLDKNNALYVNGQKKISDGALAALTIMIAESRPEEKEMMVSVVMNCMN